MKKQKKNLNPWKNRRNIVLKWKTNDKNWKKSWENVGKSWKNEKNVHHHRIYV